MNGVDSDLPLFNGQAETLSRPETVDDLPLDREIQEGEVFIIRNTESRYLTHLFHKYPGKFIPHIPRWAMRKYAGPRSLIVDPFVGSGTTLVEAMLHGHNSVGIDIDPLARLISRVKSTVLEPVRLTELLQEVPRLLKQQHGGPFRPRIPTLHHWFTESAIEDLSAIHYVVDQFQDEKPVYDFLTVCFSSIIRRASNADNQTMKTYVSGTKPKTPEAARPLFLHAINTYADRLQKLGKVVSPLVSAEVLDETVDARNVGQYWSANRRERADLAITSPPYIKSVDYIYNQMAELFWIGDRWGIENQQKQNRHKRLYVGTDKVSSKLDAERQTLGIACVDEYIRRISTQDRRSGQIAHAYFRDMLTHFVEMRDVLIPNAPYMMVVGDSTIAGIEVPTHDLIIAIAASADFRMKEHFGYEIRNRYMRYPRGGRGGVVTHDWILVLTAP